MIRHVLSKPGSLRIAFATCAAAPLLFACSAFAQEPSPAPATPTQGGPTQNAVGATAPSNAEATAERVIVTGSNIPTAEEVGPNPVDTYRQEDIQKLGVRSSTDLIQRLPAATGSALTENNTNGGDGRAEINLRGILAKETLVLIDGRRVAPVGFAGSTVDINTVPFPLIDHIDILKDGASAIYGADAVAGVFGIFLKHKFRGLEVGGSYGNSNLGASNDQGEEMGYLLAGTGDDKTDIVVFAEIYNRAGIFSRDRDISTNGNFSRFGGIDLRSSNFAGRIEVAFPDLTPGGTGKLSSNVTLTPGLLAPLNTPGTHPYDIFSPAGLAAAGYIPRVASLDTGRPANGVYKYNFAALTPAIAPVDREYFYGSVIRDVCDKWLTFFADFKYARTFWDSGLAPTPFTGPPDAFNDGPDFVSGNPISSVGPSISVPTQNAFNPFSTAVTTVNGIGFITGVRYRSLEAGLRTDKITTNNYMFTGGLRGTFSDLTTNDILKTWGYELGFRYNLDDRVEQFGGIVNVNALRSALLSTDPNTAFDIFGKNLNGSGQFGRTNPAVLKEVYVTTNHRGNTSLTLEDSKVYGDLWNLPAGPLSFAIGGEHRKETANDQPDPLTASGQTLGATNFQPTKGNRDVWATYGELRIPVTSPSWNFIGAYSLEFDVAERYEFFSDFGDTEKPKFSVRWQPIDSSLTLRATYNEAFHAPTLSELFTSQAQSFPSIVDPLGLTPDVQVQETIGGNRNLKPENAYEWTYGGVWTPKFVKGLTLSVDWYHIDLRNITALLDPQFIVNQNAKGKFPGLVERGPTGNITNVIATEMNLARIIEEGLDYEAIYQLDTSMFGRGNFGTFTFTLNGTYLARYQQQASPTQKEISIVGSFLGSTSGGSLPHDRIYTSVFYDLGGFDAGATVHYIGQVWDTPGTTNSGVNRKIREYTTLDLIASYSFNFAEPVAEQQSVAGLAKDGGKNVKMKDGKDKNVAPVTSASYSECGWRAWLNNTTLTVGMNNVFDRSPPFVAGAFENGYDESTASIQGRFWYVSIKKRF